ncbi:MAG: hypothetical protein AAFX05_11515 [Planctomycetota bacterium]
MRLGETSARRVRRWSIRGGIALACVFALPLLAHAYLTPVQFNQFLIEAADRRYGVGSLRSRLQSLGRMYTSGLRAIPKRIGDTPPPLDDPEAVLHYVLKWAPPLATVYPTECFYYYRFRDLDGQWVWGNLRIADAPGGVIGISYFHPGSPDFTHREFTAEDGVEITSVGNRRYRVEGAGRAVTFVLPEVITRPPASFGTTTDEHYVGRIVDESAIRLHLLFNTATNSFYMALDESAGIADTLEEVEEGLLLGKRSGFVYYDDEELDRRLLLGVHFENVVANNYFDGPADQVPFELELRDLMHLAYPHTMLGSGIDAHGVLLGKDEWQRVAISPFTRYRNVEELRERLAFCAAETPTVRMTCMTKEWWNSPMWLSQTIRRLWDEGKGLVGPPPGLLSLEEIFLKYPAAEVSPASSGVPEMPAFEEEDS